MKHYVEILYPNFTKGKIETRNIEVQKRDPLSIEYDGLMSGFRFYDIRESFFDGELLKGDKRNYSKTFYFGKRTNLMEIVQKMNSNPAWILSERYGYNYETPAIACDNGTYIFEPKDSVTIEEYREQNELSHKKYTIIDRKNLFIALADILSTIENELFFCKETSYEEVVNDGNSQNDILTKIGYRKYTIETQDRIILAHEYKSSFSKGDSVTTNYSDKNLDRFIPYKEIEPYLSILVDDYPYLKTFIDKILGICSQNSGILPLESIIEMEIEYLKKDEKNKNLKLSK